jgi:hypothetical protein
MQDMYMMDKSYSVPLQIAGYRSILRFFVVVSRV